MYSFLVGLSSRDRYSRLHGYMVGLSSRDRYSRLHLVLASLRCVQNSSLWLGFLRQNHCIRTYVFSCN